MGTAKCRRTTPVWKASQLGLHTNDFSASKGSLMRATSDGWMHSVWSGRLPERLGKDGFQTYLHFERIMAIAMFPINGAKIPVLDLGSVPYEHRSESAF